MILWLNGPFGVGKSTCTARLTQRDPRARVYDPERLGWVLQRTVGLVRPGDFQDLSVWRRGVVRGVARRATPDRTLVVPMTLLDEGYTDEILGGLRARGHDVLHVTLHASGDVLRARAEADQDDPGARPWRLAQAERYAAAASRLAERGPRVDTDGRTPDEVADEVTALVTAAR